MASLASTALFLCLNLVLFSFVSSHYVPCPQPPSSSSDHHGDHHGGGGHHGGGSSGGKCPVDTLKLGVCADLLDLVHVVVGTPPKTPCCTLLEGLADLEAAVCLCTAVKANVLGINLTLPIDLSILLNYCGKEVPSGFQCA